MIRLNKILLIDDDNINNFINEQLLRGLKVADTIEVLTDGRMGLEYLFRQCESPDGICPDLVIFDHHMPKMDGLEMIMVLDAMGFISSHKIIFLLLASSTKVEEVDVFLELGVHEYTVKSLSEEIVRTVCDKYL